MGLNMGLKWSLRKKVEEKGAGGALLGSWGGCKGMKKPIIASGVILAPNQYAFTDSLFNPIEGMTADGYIVRVLKKGIRLFFRGEFYTLNPHHVFCLESKLENGKTWYSYGGKLNELPMRELDELETAIRASL